jgi:ABC-type branched-subunit amino acid transport system substrate-binding protein
MVSDHVVATLYDNTYSNAAQTQGILSAAGIPRIGLFADATAEYGAKTNFDFTGGGVFCLVGMMDDLIKKGDKKLTVILPDSPSAGQTHLLFDPIAKAEGAQVVNYVLVSSASGDYSQYVAQAQQNGAQGIVIALGNAQIVQFAEALNQLNPKIDYTTGIAGFSLNQLKTLGQFATKAGFVWWVPGIDDTKNFPGLKQVLADITANEKGASVNNLTGTSVQGWLAVHSFYEVMKSQTGTPTAASVLGAFQAAKNIPMNGIVKPWTPTDYQNAGSLSSIFPYVSNPWIYRNSYNGKNTTTIPSQAFNTFAGL